VRLTTDFVGSGMSGDHTKYLRKHIAKCENIMELSDRLISTYQRLMSQV
jgi:hypothetical protein